MKDIASYIPADDPDLDRDYITGREFENGTKTAVRTISRDHGTDISFQGSGAYTDGKRVVLPAMPEDKKLTYRQAHVARGFANHETLHKLLTDFDNCGPRMKEYTESGRGFTNHMAQAIEDVRIENGGRHLYHGMSKSLNEVADQVCRSFVENTLVERPELATDLKAMLPLAITWAGRLRLGYPSEMIQAAFDMMDERIQERASLTVDAIMTIPHGVKGVGEIDTALAHKGCGIGLDLAEKVANEVREELEKEKQEQSQGESDDEHEEPESMDQSESDDGEPHIPGDDEQGEGRDSTGGADGDDSLPDGQDDSDERDDDQGDSDDEEPVSSGHGPDTDDHDDDLSPELNKVVENMLSEVTRTGTRTSLTNHVPYTRDHDQVLERGKPYTHWGEGGYYRAAQRKLNSKDNAYHYEEVRKLVGPHLSTMRRKLERMLLAEQRTDWEAGRAGKLDVRRRCRDIAMGGENVFRRPIEGKSLDTAVTILVDLSGSMNHDRIDLAMQACIALSESLEAASVPFEILGHFTTSYENSDDWHAATMKMYNDELDSCGRLESIIMPVYKSFNQTLRQGKQSIGAMDKMCEGANADADAILMAARRLTKRREKRKILMVLSDGAPAWRAMVRGEDGQYVDREDYTNQITREAVAACEAKGVETIGIGIQSSAVENFYERHAVVRGTGDLGKAMLDELGRVLLGKRFRVDNADLIQAREGARRAFA